VDFLREIERVCARGGGRKTDQVISVATQYPFKNEVSSRGLEGNSTRPRVRSYRGLKIYKSKFTGGEVWRSEEGSTKKAVTRRLLARRRFL